MNMVGEFALDYFLLVFIAALGVLQVVAAYSDLRGLLFIRARLVAFLAGLLTAATSFLWFFLSEPRNISDKAGGLDGNQMAALFSVAAGSALVLTLLLSSIRNRSMRRVGQEYNSGLDALKETTYLIALVNTLRTRWKRY